jgi:hypothetical protein
MPRRHVITDAQFVRLLALPTGEADLIRHYTLSPSALAMIAGRRRPYSHPPASDRATAYTGAPQGLCAKQR